MDSKPKTKSSSLDTEDKDAIEALKTQIAELQKVADAQKIELGLAVEKSTTGNDVVEGSLKDIQSQLSKAKEKLNLVNP